MHRFIGYVFLNENKEPIVNEYGHILILTNPRHLDQNENIDHSKIFPKKILDSQIVEYMESGFQCAFDQHAYERFYPIARKIFNEVEPPNLFEKGGQEPDEVNFCSLGFAQ